MRMLVRRLPKQKAARKKLATAIGELILAHNSVHTSFACIFMAAINNVEVAENVWHTQRTDRAQRNLVMAAVRGRFSPTSKLFKAICWALKKADALAELRNDVVHIDSWIDVQVKPYVVKFSTVASLPSRVERLSREVKMTQSLSTATMDLRKLTVYALELANLMEFFPKYPRPLPKRPRLHFVRGKHRHVALYPDTLL